MKLLCTSIGLLFTAALLYGQQTAPILSESPIIIQLSPAPQMGDNQVRGGSSSPTSLAIATTPQGIKESFKESLKSTSISMPNGEPLTNLLATQYIIKSKVSIIHSPDE